MYHIGIPVQDIVSVEQDFSHEPGVRVQVVQAIDGSEQGAFTTTGRPDERRDFPLGDT